LLGFDRGEGEADGSDDVGGDVGGGGGGDNEGGRIGLIGEERKKSRRESRKPSWGRVAGGAHMVVVRNALRSWSHNTGVTTTSERGGKRGLRAFVIPPLQVKAVDVIGAADAAVGGLVAALALRLPLRHAMVWATCCGALSLLSTGAQDSMASSERLQVRTQYLL
jgi:sugar/nucleoside kinase (ribokinase family)